MRPISIYDSKSASLVRLKPDGGKKIDIYVCGPTVYSPIHIGNARPFIVFAVLKRFLQHEGYEVTLVSNITDINDKIYTAAEKAGSSSTELAEEMTKRYVADTNRLELGRADHEPKASEYVDEIVELIQALIDNGSAYAVEGDVYFRVSSYPEYGELSHRSVDQMDQGEVGVREGRKESNLDFALWKAHKEGEDTSWAAPWGRGRPGWHIECSAMAEGELGTGFDIHGGGTDLLFPHHENECAQTKAARSEQLAQVWMHSGMLRLEGEKMAKSLGNIKLLSEVLDQHGRDVTVLYILSGQYRKPLIFSEEQLQEAAAKVRRIEAVKESLSEGPTASEFADLKEQFFVALADDFNTPKALAVIFSWIREANRSSEPVGSGDLKEMLDVLGLASLLEDGDANADRQEIPVDVQELYQQRQHARAAGEYGQADRFRAELLAKGWEVKDSAEGSKLVRVGS